jgi:S-adenosylmethionine hydrolase
MVRRTTSEGKYIKDMIALLTDFGQSEYVGVMKGVILGIARDAKIIDLCHSIGPQSIIEGSWVLLKSFRYFPAGCVFCCVVDPGVGTARKALAVKTDDYFFVGPDNGILWETLKEQKIIEIREIPVPADASRTFHGRDVFAKAAAEIELGKFAKIGKRTEQITSFEYHIKGREGIVVRIDSFGNVITNLESLGKNVYLVEIGDEKYELGFRSDYQSAGQDELFLIEGSSGALEISLKGGSAQERLCLSAGRKLRIF